MSPDGPNNAQLGDSNPYDRRRFHVLEAMIDILRLWVSGTVCQARIERETHISLGVGIVASENHIQSLDGTLSGW